jgi:hypothetical protein
VIKILIFLLTNVVPKLTHCGSSITAAVESGMTTLPTAVVSRNTMKMQINEEKEHSN